MGIFEQLDWLTKKVERLCCWVKELVDNPTPGPPGPQGPPGPAGTLTDAYYAAFYSHVKQSDGISVEQLMRFEITDFADGISILILR